MNLTAALDAEVAYKDADSVVIAAPTNYDSKKNFLDTSAVEAVTKRAWRFLEKSLWMRANKELQIRPKPAIITASTRFSSCTVRVLHFLCKTAERGGCLQNVDSASGLLRIKCNNSHFPKLNERMR